MVAVSGQQRSVFYLFDVFAAFAVFRQPRSNEGCSNHNVWSRIAPNVEQAISYKLPGLSLFLMEQTIQVRQA